MPVFIPSSLAEATHLLSNNPSAHLLTGGTDLMVEVNFNHRHPETVISLRKVPEFQQWNVDNITGLVHIGSSVPYAMMEHGELAQALPALAEAARTVGSPQIRAAGSLGGNLGTCSPAGDSLPVLSALDAVIHLQSETASRSVTFADFMVGPKKTSRLPNEIISGVTIPLINGWQGYAKVGVRNAMVISIASVCLAIHDGNVRVALGSVGPTIIRGSESEAWINSVGLENVDLSVAKEFGERVRAESRPINDHRSTAEYRRHAVGVLATRLLLRGIQK
ncbi:MAG: FAD binding domain-containing protein [Ilumatobacteraceae bacterium]|nr:FAD binding domain-containing protein [Ilumatobacteraceae bacterium]